MKLAVRNLLRIKKADLDIAPGQIALVCGDNDQGKSSLVETAGAVVTGLPFMRTITSKTKAIQLVRDGTKSGRVVFGNGSSMVQLNYPDCEKETKGEVMDDGHPLVVGTVNLMDMKPDARLSVMIDMLGAHATQADLIQYLKGNGITNATDKLWAKIEQDGWDVVHDLVKEKGRKRKAVWEHLTGTAWGKNKAVDWIPDGFDYDVAVNYEKAVETRQKILEAAIANQAVSQDRIDALNATVVTGLEAEERLEQIPAEMTKLEEELAGRVRICDAYPLDPANVRKLRCPHCAKDVVLDKRKLGTAELELPTAELDEESLKKQRMDWSRDDGDRSNCEDRIKMLNNERLRCEQTVQAAAKATDELDKADTNSEATTDLQQARADLAAAETELAALKRMKEAEKINKEITANLILIDAVGPKGARQIPITKALADLNGKLAQMVAHMVPFPPVKIEDDMTMTVGGRLYAMESESNQFRADIALRCVLAKHYVHCPLLLVDRLDVLVGGSRTGVLRALGSTGAPSLVTMSAKSQDVVPAIEKAKMGSRYWMEDGELKPFAK